MKIWVYPGSFDPVTLGHIDIIKRSLTLCDKLYVAILNNNEKNSLFSVANRVKMLQKVLLGMDNVEIITFSGLQVDLFKDLGATAFVRGLRDAKDFEYENLISDTNKILLSDFECVYLPTSDKLKRVSSSSVKTIASFGGDVSAFVSPEVETMIKDKFKEKYQ